jgi:alkanesulfonate monooxygenase SsuD/methylene tetrahydromethanopterin reductase-like flavin-dependent oxidoreductase (luciferase family)
MKFGYFENLKDPTQQRPYRDLVAEMREVAILLDEGGFDYIWLPEHHFSIWGRELLGNPLLALADLAVRTKRIRLGLAAAIITHWHPLRLAEDLALLDNLTDGRLEIGVGRGNYGLEATNLNPIADPNNQDQNFKVFTESFEIIKKALSEDRFSYRGQFYQFPAPGFRADRAHSVNDPAYVDAATGERFWQDESFDHWVRDPAEWQKIRAYIERNPVSAGLVAKPEEWPWSSASRPIEG